jgi:hypothetical protein
MHFVRSFLHLSDGWLYDAQRATRRLSAVRLTDEFSVRRARRAAHGRPGVAARCGASIVVLPLALRMRSTWARLVCISSARRAFVMPWGCISWASSQVMTQLVAVACAA